MPNPIDLTGQRSGKLVAVHYVKGDRNQKRAWLCNCDCGGTVTVKTQLFREGKVQSCGCLNHQPLTGSASLTHGHARRRKVSPTNMAWKNMIQRCTNPNRHDYRHYGGRGITICDRWLNSFENFLADMGERPIGLSIDRIKNHLGYYPENCRWANQKTQVHNSSAVRLITFRGETHCISEWAGIIGITSARLRQRLEAWPFERAMTYRRLHSSLDTNAP